jgi:hypothetical protein
MKMLCFKPIAILFLATAISLSCNAEPKKDSNKKDKSSSAKQIDKYNAVPLPQQLKEVSGMTREGDNLWMISDATTPIIYKLNRQGKIIQEIALKNVNVLDMESLSSDDKYVYIGDIGNNKNNRIERSVIKIPKANLGSSAREVSGDVTSFTFEQARRNNPNCEAMFVHKGTLYFFTKQDDSKTQLFSLSSNEKDGIARRISELEVNGMITGASINNNGNEIALIGYRNGHTYPFIILINDFKGEDFFSGKVSRYELDDTKRDWQVESISYLNDDTFIFACEGTKDVHQSLFTISRSELTQLPQVLADNVNSQKEKKGKKNKKKD